MNHRLFIRVAAPAVLIGLLLFGSCVAGIRYINSLQSNLADILNENVTSLEAAQDLEIRVRQLRYHTMLYLMDPNAERLKPIADDEQRFEKALAVAHDACKRDEELACVRLIRERYRDYQEEQAGLRIAAAEDLSRDNLNAYSSLVVQHHPFTAAACSSYFLRGPRGTPVEEFVHLLNSHSVRLVVDPCQQLLRINKEHLDETAEKSKEMSSDAHIALLVLGLAGPIGGILLGYCVARALKRSIYRLSVRVQDMAQRLNHKVASVSVMADGDMQALDNQMQHIVEKVEEVTARAQQQQRELVRAEQLATMGQLAAGVAHEIRNPLTAIKMLVEAALRAKKPRPLSDEDVQIIHREVARLEWTVQGFLDFARLPPPERSMCDLRLAVKQAQELVHARARQQHVEMIFETPDYPVPALVDLALLETVLVNVLLNALDAMPNGGRLEVTLAAPVDSDIHLTIRDSGEGIAPELLDRLFRPFVTTKPQGTGLGLSLSARIIEDHGGSLSASNRPEGGACFVIALPAFSEKREPLGV